MRAPRMLRLMTLRIRISLALAFTIAAAVMMVVFLADSGSAPARPALHHHRCIPQHNRGDHDADNRGGPSDGDGCR